MLLKRIGLAVLSIFLMSQAWAADEKTAQAPSVAIFAGGCFWCMEPPFDKLDGVLTTTSGYIGGEASTANYKKVSAGVTRHYEAVKIEYDASKVSFDTLLAVFWKNVDPFDNRGQFCDKGDQYLSAIFYLDDDQLASAKVSFEKTQAMLDKPIVTRIVKAAEFYAAEQYHQDYYQRNPIRYKFYRRGCGRDKRLEQVWGQ